MDKATLQQLIYAHTFLDLWIDKGPEVWEFMDFSPVKTDVELDGKLADTDELSRYGIEAKRAGKYAEVIGAYIRCMMAFYQKKGKIPVLLVRGLFKVLVSVNCFSMAFTLVSTILADMQQSQNVDQEEMDLFKNYFLELLTLSKNVIDDDDVSKIKEYSRLYSGSSDYRLQRSMSDIRKDFEEIREKVRNIYDV